LIDMPANLPPAEVLIFFANPSSSGRLRLDKEDRMYDDLRRECELGNRPLHFTKRHATTSDDFIEMLDSKPFEIIQFSGHGSSKGSIFLEDPDSDQGILVSTSDIEAVVRARGPKELKLLAFVCCFSSKMLHGLTACAPNILVVEGEANDRTAVAFMRNFYLEYSRSGSPLRAFETAKLKLKLQDKSEGMPVVLFRREVRDEQQRLIIESRTDSFQESIFVDLSEVESSFARLGLSHDFIVDQISHRIRVHREIFRVPREHALLIVGSELIGYFSWTQFGSRIRCTKLLRVATDIDPAFWRAWVNLLTAYNDLSSEGYRDPKHTPSPADRGMLARATKRFRRALESAERLFSVCDVSVSRTVIKEIVTASAYVERAEQRLDLDEIDRVAEHLEQALSTIHRGIVESLPSD
jgi:hypothetical protein